MTTLITLSLSKQSDIEFAALLLGLWQYADHELEQAKKRLSPAPDFGVAA